jgi:hypothetical protein
LVANPSLSGARQRGVFKVPGLLKMTSYAIRSSQKAILPVYMRRIRLVLFCLGLTGWLFCVPPAGAQRVVVVCLRPTEVPLLMRHTATMPGAQALLLSRVASSPRRPSLLLPVAQWERSAYLTLNAGTRALVPENLSPNDTERLRQLEQENQQWGYPVLVGLLPTELKKSGVRMRYLTTRRDSPMLLASIPLSAGDVKVVSDVATLFAQAEWELRRYWRSMLWIDANTLEPAQLGLFIQRLQAALTRPDDVLYLLVPVPSPSESAMGSRLGWGLRLGADGEGLLVSGSSRLPGYITLPDLTATWLSHFGCTEMPAGVVGSPTRVLPNDSPVQTTQRLYDSLMRQAWWNRTVGALPTGQLVALVLAWFWWWRLKRVVRPLWLFPCVVPVLGVSLVPVLICLPMGGISWQARVAIWLISAGGLLIALSRLSLRQSLRGLGTVLLVFVGVDLLHGGNLLRWSGYGYVLQEGARFYGVGNEMAGSLFGAQSGFLLAESGGWSLLRWTLTAVAVGAPFWGANTGAMLSAFGVAMFIALRRWRWWGVGMLLSVLAVVVLWELLSPSPSHLGRFLRDPSVWLPTVARKGQMNLSLLLSSAWTPLLLFGLCGLKGAPAPVWMGAILLLVLNDSGVVAAASMLTWWWAWRVAHSESAS